MEKRRPFGCAEGKEALRGSGQTTAIGELSHSYLKSIAAHEAIDRQDAFCTVGKLRSQVVCSLEGRERAGPCGESGRGCCTVWSNAKKISSRLESSHQRWQALAKRSWTLIAHIGRSMQRISLC